MKKNLIIYITIFIFIVLVFFIIFEISNKNKTELPDKLSSEIQYMDRNLISMLNKVNNIQFPNYIVTVEKIEERDSSKSEGQSASNQDNSSKSQASGSEEGKSR